MSNQANISRTTFQSLDASGEVESESYGIRIYDDYGTGYTNLIDDRDQLKGLSASEIVTLAYEIEPTGTAMIDHVLKYGSLVWIDNVPFSLTKTKDGFDVQPVRFFEPGVYSASVDGASQA